MMRETQLWAEQSGLAIQTANSGLWDWDVYRGDIVCDERTCEILGRPAQSQLDYFAILQLIHPDDRGAFEAAVRRALDPSGDGALSIDCRIILPNGSQRWITTVGSARFKDRGAEKTATRLAGVAQDITERKRSDTIVACQKHALELIAQSAPIADVLEVLTRTIEELSGDGLVSSILLLDSDGTTLRHGAAPNLPLSYTRAIDGTAIGPSVGSCGTAAYRGQTVVVSDIATDPLWSDYRSLALSHGLRACWSTPILSASGTVLGTFAFYYGQPRDPTPDDLEVVRILTHTAAIAIERARAEDRLKTRNLRLSLLSEALERLLCSRESDLVVRELFSKFAAQLDVDAYFNYRVDPDGEALHLSSYAGIPENAARQIRHVNLGEAICGAVAQSREPLVVTDIRQSDDEKTSVLRNVGIQAYACYPLMTGYRVLGTLSFASRARTRFDAEDLEFIRLISRYVALAMERADAEQRLRVSEEEFRALFERAGVGKAEIDCKTGRFLRVNRKLCDFLGYSEEDLLTKALADVIDTEDDQLSATSMAKLTRGEVTEACFENRYVRHQGAIVWGDTTVTMVRGADGEPSRFLAVVQDVTLRKRAEAELQELNEELESKVAERTEEVTCINQELVHQLSETKRLQAQLLQSQKMESIGTLAGGIAHDFNNLLNIISGYAELIFRRPTDSDSVSKHVQVIKETVQRGSTVVQQLLAITRKTAIKFERVDLNDLLRKLEALLNIAFPETVNFTLQLDQNLPPVLADPNQLNQILLNICLNARDAMPAGGHLFLRTETVTGADLRRRFQEATEEQYASIKVADTGGGMTAETRRRVFEPFYTTKEQGQGTGLGLSVVYGIVSNHGGFVDVESELGRGSTFSIYLPIRSNIEETSGGTPDGRRAQFGSASGKGEMLLVVEDEPRQRFLLQNVLELEGYRVLTASDGLEAVQIHLRYKDEIALVLMDLGLPKLDGWSAYERMKQTNPSVPTLFATGNPSPQVEQEISKGTLRGIIKKPYRLEEIFRGISEALHSRE